MRKFNTGAIRDDKEGKGRCDLMPLNVISTWMGDNVLGYVSEFRETGDENYLYDILWCEIPKVEIPKYTLELSKHFEKGAIKYGIRNWEKGIPLSSYIDSAIRHYLKHLAGEDDENHFIAFIWNIVCAIWTIENKPELDDFTKLEKL